MFPIASENLPSPPPPPKKYLFPSSISSSVFPSSFQLQEGGCSLNLQLSVPSASSDFVFFRLLVSHLETPKPKAPPMSGSPLTAVPKKTTGTLRNGHTNSHQRSFDQENDLTPGVWLAKKIDSHDSIPNKI